SSLTLRGTASGATQVMWASNRGGNGIATGTTSWTASGIVLQPGVNLLFVIALDAAGHTTTVTVTVTYTPCLVILCMTVRYPRAVYPTPTRAEPESGENLTAGETSLSVCGRGLRCVEGGLAGAAQAVAR